MQRITRRLVVAASVASVVLTASAAIAGTGIGGVFNLGRTNTVDRTTTLTGSADNATLHVANTESGAANTGIEISVKPGSPPLQVNSTTRVSHLNADTVDGMHARAFLRNRVPLALSGATASAGIVQATNHGTGMGVHAVTRGTGDAVFGESTGGGSGVEARSNGTALFAQTDTGTAVLANTTGGGIAGHFVGRVVVDGDLTVNGTPSGVIAGTGLAQGRAVALPPGGQAGVIAVAGFFDVDYGCPLSPSDPGNLVVANLTTDTVNAFVDKGSANPTYVQIAPDDIYQDPALNAGGDFVTIQIHSPSTGIATITMFTVNRATDCHAEAQAVVTS